MAAAAVLPASVPTALGARETVDLASPTLNFQRIEDPQVNLQQCSSKYGAQVVRSIFEKLEERKLQANFTCINFSDNQIGDEGAKWLQEGLVGNAALKTLLLPRAAIKAPGFQALGKLLADNSSLDEVVLSSNICGPAGMKGEFSAGLAKNTTLKSLYLGVCRIGDEGMQALCEGPLKVHPALEHLNLTYNRLEAPCIKFLNDALAANNALVHLDLSGNSIGPDGAIELVNGLKANKGKLQKLSVAQNEIRLAGCRALALFFTSKDGEKMEYMDLRHNNVRYMGAEELRKELGRPLDGSEEGWCLEYGERQLFLNAY